jgi:hypothetical protein
MGIAAALAVVVVIVVVSVPEGEGPEPFGRAAPAADAAVEILLRVETVDAGHGLIRAPLTVRPGPSFPQLAPGCRGRGGGPRLLRLPSLRLP